MAELFYIVVIFLGHFVDLSCSVLALDKIRKVDKFWLDAEKNGIAKFFVRNFGLPFGAVVFSIVAVSLFEVLIFVGTTDSLAFMAGIMLSGGVYTFVVTKNIISVGHV